MSSSRSKAVAYRDDSVGLVVYYPIRKGASGADGSWRVSYRDPITRKRKQPRLRGTRDQVVRQAKRIAQDLEASRTHEWREVTFRQLCDRYLADPRHSWEPSTRRQQKRGCALLCDDAELGEQPLGELVHSAKRLRQGLEKLAVRVSPRTGRPYAQATLKLYRDLLGTVLSWGQHEEIIPRELIPMKGVGVPKASAGAKRAAKVALRSDDEDGARGALLITEAEIPSMEQIERLAAVWADRAPGRPWWRALSVRLAATAGLRWGEQHALTPEDLVWDEKQPHIGVERKLLISKTGSVVGTSLPKMGKPRKALLPEHLVDDLRRRAAEVGPGRLLFPSPMDPDRPYEPDSFGSSMRRYATHVGWPTDEHGLHLHTWHSLRHHAAVWQLRDVGVDPALVSEALGHASVRFTLDRYVGTTTDSWKIAAEQMRRWKTDG